MTELIKSNWTSDGDSLRMSMPIAKVDKQSRQVSGWATLDNVDSQNETSAVTEEDRVDTENGTVTTDSNPGTPLVSPLNTIPKAAGVQPVTETTQTE